ncbi:MAG: hypoxanthine phosphoribosyltransferase [bacterium]|nr:hypoxanthine phosphoribosyltransferase [bacterium]
MVALSADNIVTLKTSRQIKACVQKLGKEIARDYADKDLVLVGVLNGAFMFLGDLKQKIDPPPTIAFIQVESYEKTTSSRKVRIIKDLAQPIEGRDVLIVEDIIDTGHTMQYLLEHLRTRKPTSLKVCSLLFKPARNIIPVTIDYLGFKIPNVFVVGYGMDYDGMYRDLPFIGVLPDTKSSQ